MVNPAKEKKVEELTEKLLRAQSIILADFKGIGVMDINDLRTRLREQNSELKVIKNRLTKLALRKAGLESLDEMLIGPTALALGYEDVVAPAKVLTEFSKKNENLKIKGGLLEKKRIGIEIVSQLAAIPSRTELIARFLGSVKAPPTKLSQVLRTSVSKIAYALKAVADAKA